MYKLYARRRKVTKVALRTAEKCELIENVVSGRVEIAVRRTVLQGNPRTAKSSARSSVGKHLVDDLFPCGGGHRGI